VNTYLRFPSPAAAKAFAARMPAFVVRHGTTDLGANADKTMQLTLLPLTDLHLTPAGREMASARQTILTLGIVGVLTLLIAIVNYVNLATARAGLRAREVAMRKVLGASRGMLVRQFAGEAILTTALAALVALALAELGLPLVNAAAGWRCPSLMPRSCPRCWCSPWSSGLPRASIRPCCWRAFPLLPCWHRHARPEAAAPAPGCAKCWSCSSSRWPRRSSPARWCWWRRPAICGRPISALPAMG
jgi:hypothetical protein